ncbi:MAG TPA: transaldolase, partial [Actinobacteria bacterium]|nr:transaldolase [Actinomycetota bacterium]
DRTDGVDGYVSVEVSPDLAHDTAATVAEAREWVKRVDRPNLLIKVPATAEGIPAVRELIAEGISVNVTLIFALDRYGEVMEAYQSGLEGFAAIGGDVSHVASVASFFVSRVDTEVDKRLENIRTDDALALRGKAAVANARAAYGAFLEILSGDRWDALAAKGARIQRPLWASTSTKNAAYSDVMYVEDLVAPDTVNTIPISTIEAYQDHGSPDPKVFTSTDIAAAVETLDRLASVGIDYDDVVQVLEDEGVGKFADAYHRLLASIDEKRAALAG